MSGFIQLFAHKKHSMTIVGLLLIALLESDVVGWLPNLNDHQITCLTILVATAVICQTAHDIVELFRTKKVTFTPTADKGQQT